MLVKVMAPYDSEDARGLLKAAIRDPDPVIFLENEILYGSAFPVDDKVLDKDFLLPIGKCKVRWQGPNSLHSVIGCNSNHCHIEKHRNATDASSRAHWVSNVLPTIAFCLPDIVRCHICKAYQYIR